MPFDANHKAGLGNICETDAYSHSDAVLVRYRARHLEPSTEVGTGYSSCMKSYSNDVHFDGAIEATPIAPVSGATRIGIVTRRAGRCPHRLTTTAGC